jgi:hypothetical protein
LYDFENILSMHAKKSDLEVSQRSSSTLNLGKSVVWRHFGHQILAIWSNSVSLDYQNDHF